MAVHPLVVWQLSDGKRGHEQQSNGLIAALAARAEVLQHRVAIDRARLRYALGAAGAQFRPGRLLPRPDLIIGAGRACQLPLIAARRAHGGRSIYLMRPGVPLGWFDLCVIPRHDQPPARANVLVSEGPLNPMRPAAHKTAELGVILIGGPSAHYAWDSSAMVAQIEAVVASAPHINWHITDSRRTPRDFTLALAARPELAARYRAFESCPATWLATTLAQAGTAWVSADSVAMIYEALSAGAAVGVLEVPAKQPDRINTIAADLLRRGWISAPGTVPVPPPTALDEAGRIASAVLERWGLGGNVTA